MIKMKEKILFPFNFQKLKTKTTKKIPPKT